MQNHWPIRCEGVFSGIPRIQCTRGNCCVVCRRRLSSLDWQVYVKEGMFGVKRDILSINLETEKSLGQIRQKDIQDVDNKSGKDDV